MAWDSRADRKLLGQLVEIFDIPGRGLKVFSETEQRLRSWLRLTTPMDPGFHAVARAFHGLPSLKLMW